MMKKLRYLVMSLTLSGAFLVIAGCAPLTSSEPPPAVYRLEPDPPEMTGTVVLDEEAVIAVESPRLPAGFSGREIILVFEGGRRQDYYAGAAWAGNLDELVRQFIVNNMREGYPGLIADTTQGGVDAGYVLNAEVLDFQPEYQGGPEGLPRLHVRINYILQDAVTRRTVADFTLERTATVRQNNLTVITAGLEQLLQEVTDEALTKIAQALKAS